MTNIREGYDMLSGFGILLGLGTMLQKNSSCIRVYIQIFQKRHIIKYIISPNTFLLFSSCFQQFVRKIGESWLMGLRCAFVPIFEGRHYHLGPICIRILFASFRFVKTKIAQFASNSNCPRMAG